MALFDFILYIDDSGSMAFEEGGERIDDLKLILSRVAFATSLFDHDGIQVRFMNSNVQGDNISTEAQAMQLVSQVKFSGLTPLGTSLQRKVLEPLVLGPARQGRLQKPVVVIAITDGTPAGENKDEVFNVISRTDRELSQTRYGRDAISYRECLCRRQADWQSLLKSETTSRPSSSSPRSTTTPWSETSSTARPTTRPSRPRWPRRVLTVSSKSPETLRGLREDQSPFALLTG